MSAIATGHHHVCALIDQGAVKCWGRNSSGELGLGDTNHRGDTSTEMGDNLPTVELGVGRSAKAVVAGASHTCALLDNNGVKCWGFNGEGQLGLGNTNWRGISASQMGDALPEVDLGTNRSAAALVAGSDHTCALLDNGTVKCWGGNSEGELGLADVNNRGDAASEMGDNLPTVNLGTGRTAKALSAGGRHTCALLDNGVTKCWGRNADGELGVGSTGNRGGAAGDMGDNLPALDLGSGRSAKALASGGTHTCALLDDGAVKCWGRNAEGELGLGETMHRGTTSADMGDNLPAVDLGIGAARK